MKRSIFLLAALGLTLSTNAAPNAVVHCGANQERVWVYDNITSFDVGERLRCGDSVSILGWQAGYVKVRTADGYEGFVAANSLPSDVVASVAPPATPAPVPAAMPATVMPAAAAPRTVAVAAPAAPVIPAPPAVTVAPAATTGAPAIAPAATAASAPTLAKTVAPVPAAPVAAVAAAPAPAQEQTAPRVSPTISVAANSPGGTAARTASSPVRTAPAVAVAAAPPPAAAPVWIAPPPPAAPATAPAPQVASSRPANSAGAAASAPKESASLVIEPVSTSISITPAAVPKPAMVKAADVSSSTIVRPAVSEGPRRSAAFADDEDDVPDVDASAKDDPASCNVFFSAYGLTPGQLRWFAANRRKQFPGVCPAPAPSMVDYVVIFTHDNNFYTASMPEPVHTDKNGFSDWSPVTPVDDTLVPAAELDKSRHEYAWVFHYHRGTFDPANFSGKRKPQFAKTDHGSAKAAEDALQFMAEGGSGQ